MIGFHGGRLVSAQAPRTPKLGDLLISSGMIDRGILEGAIRAQNEERERRSLGQILVSSGIDRRRGAAPGDRRADRAGGLRGDGLGHRHLRVRHRRPAADRRHRPLPERRAAGRRHQHPDGAARGGADLRRAQPRRRRRQCRVDGRGGGVRPAAATRRGTRPIRRSSTRRPAAGTALAVAEPDELELREAPRSMPPSCCALHDRLHRTWRSPSSLAEALRARGGGGRDGAARPGRHRRARRAAADRAGRPAARRRHPGARRRRSGAPRRGPRSSPWSSPGTSFARVYEAGDAGGAAGRRRGRRGLRRERHREPARPGARRAAAGHPLGRRPAAPGLRRPALGADLGHRGAQPDAHHLGVGGAGGALPGQARPPGGAGRLRHRSQAAGRSPR